MRWVRAAIVLQGCCSLILGVVSVALCRNNRKLAADFRRERCSALVIALPRHRSVQPLSAGCSQRRPRPFANLLHSAHRHCWMICRQRVMRVTRARTMTTRRTEPRARVSTRLDMFLILCRAGAMTAGQRGRKLVLAALTGGVYSTSGVTSQLDCRRLAQVLSRKLSCPSTPSSSSLDLSAGRRHRHQPHLLPRERARAPTPLADPAARRSIARPAAVHM